MTQITLKRSRLDWALEIVGALVILVTFVLVAIQFNDLPEHVPIHFDASGTPDSYGSKTSLIFLPMIGLFVYGMVSMAKNYSYAFNYLVLVTDENRERQFRNAVLMLRVLKVVIAIIFLILTQFVIETAKGIMPGLSVWFLPAFVVSIFGLIGFFVIRSFRLK